MTLVFLIVLGLAWAAVFVPAAVRARQRTPYSSAERFSRGMGLLAKPTLRRGRYVVMPQSTDRLTRSALRRSRARRRRVFTALVLGAVSTFLLALLVGVSWNVHLVVDAFLIAYVALLLILKQQQIDARKVAHISTPRAEQEVEFYEPVHATGGGRG